MISFFSGTILLVGTASLLWHLLPRDGVPHRLSVMPYVQVWIPVGIVSGLVIGIGLMVAGLVDIMF
jgi:hypothetical protein